MEKEFISHEAGDHYAWICVCGNTPCGGGFFECDERGNQVEPTAAAWTTDLYVCDQCGRMINPDTLEVVGQRKESCETVFA